MAHYLIEMQSDEEASRRNEWDHKLANLHQRGYVSSVSHSVINHVGGGYEPMMHRPCGLMVGDPDRHDRFCPAKGE
jgi:hypothetical protein